MKTFCIRFLLLWSLVLGWANSTVAPVAAQREVPTRFAPTAVAVVDNDKALQFTSAGHALSFHPTQFFASNGRYALRVQFLGARPTTPVSAEARKLLGPDPQLSQQTPALTQVRYPNLWSGITLAYDAPAGSILRSMNGINSLLCDFAASSRSFNKDMNSLL